MEITKRKKLLTTNNAKTVKGEKIGYVTYILYMSPFKTNSTGKNVCSHASKGCVESCLFGSGFGGMFTAVMNGRINRTEYFLKHRIEFLNQVKTEIEKALKKHEGKAKITIRLNGTSDVPYENLRVFGNKNIFELFPKVKFYDYTKNYLRFGKVLPKNYTLTFSRSEINHDKTMEMLANGHNVSIVFDKVPKKYLGYKVIDGDKNDLRFKDPKNVIVGLRYKKMTSRGANNKLGIESGFVIDTSKSPSLNVSVKFAA